MVAVLADEPAPNMSRLAAITHIAVFEAVNAVTGDHHSYLGTPMSSPGSSAAAATVAAAHGVLRHYVPARAAILDAPAPSTPGEWQLTTGCPSTGGVFLHWRHVTPFALRHAHQFRSEPPPSLASSKYARAYREIKEVAGRDSTERPPDRADVAKVYAALGGVPLWNPIARQMARAYRRSLVETPGCSRSSTWP